MSGTSAGKPAVSSRFRVHDSSREDCLVVAVSGEVDLSTAPTLRDHLLDRVELGERRLVVDLSDVGFLDSTGLGVLVMAYRAATQAGGGMVVACARPPVRRVLKITRLDVLLDHHSDLAGAVAAASATRDGSAESPALGA